MCVYPTRLHCKSHCHNTNRTPSKSIFNIEGLKEGIIIRIVYRIGCSRHISTIKPRARCKGPEKNITWHIDHSRCCISSDPCLLYAQFFTNATKSGG